MPENLRRMLAWVVTLGLTGIVIWGLVVGEDSDVDRIQALGAKIKCPVCQGEAISESPSETAVAMMEVLAEKVTAGQSDGQIIAYFTDRYGDGILLDPRFELRTMLLWLLPAAALVGGVGAIVTRRRRPEGDGA